MQTAAPNVSSQAVQTAIQSRNSKASPAAACFTCPCQSLQRQQTVKHLRRRVLQSFRRRPGVQCYADPPNFNPQNVPDPQVMPSRDFGPRETVAAQLDALRDNDKPWRVPANYLHVPNHGLQTAYEFGEDIGGMERSRYFGYSKDLYHFDHFLGQFQNAFPELVGLTDYSIGDVEETAPGSFTVPVAVTRHGAKAELRFLLVRKDIGRKKGSLMTKSLLRA